MKLQRNNKYSNMITNGLVIVIITSLLLSGCTNDVVDDEKSSCEYLYETTITASPEPVIEEIQDDRILLEKLTEQEENDALETLGVISDETVYNLGTFFSIEFVDAEGNYKVMFTTVNSGDKPNSFVVYDAFTDLPLFSYISNEPDMIDNFCRRDITDFYDENALFVNCNELNMDVHIELVNNLIYKGIRYDDFYNYMYFPAEGSSDLFFTREELARAYVNLVPEQFRVTAKDLGLVYDEDVYLSKLSIEEEEKAVYELAVLPDDTKYELSRFNTLDFVDSNNNYRVMFVSIFSGDMANAYTVRDAFTDLPLFSYISNETNMINNLYKDNLTDFFDENCALVNCTNLSIGFNIELVNHMVNKNVIYENQFNFEYFPMEFSSSDFFFTREELARAYVNLVPEQFRVTAKDLGLVYDEVEKVYKLG